MPPLTPDQQKTSPQFFEILGFAMRFAPVLPDEKEMRDRFASIGIGPEGNFDADKLSPEMRKAVEDGMADAWAEFDTFKKDKIDTDEVTSAQLLRHGSGPEGQLPVPDGRRGARHLRQHRRGGASTPARSTTPRAQPLTGADKYVYKFAKDQLPPVNAFWSLTMYELPQSLLVANPINRYLINSPMLPSLVPDKDGGYTFYLQNESPGPDKESNWLPAPKGPFVVVLRLYWPKPDALNGTWTGAQTREGLAPACQLFRYRGSLARGGADSARTRRPARRRRSCPAPRSCPPRRHRAVRGTTTYSAISSSSDVISVTASSHSSAWEGRSASGTSMSRTSSTRRSSATVAFGLGGCET